MSNDEAHEAPATPENQDILYLEGSLLLMTSNSSTEIKIAKSKKAISLHQQCAPATIYKNSDIDPYIMVSAGEYIIKC